MIILIFITLSSFAAQYKNGVVYTPVKTDCQKVIDHIRGRYPRDNNVTCGPSGKVDITIRSMSNDQLSALIIKLKKQFPKAF